MKAIFLPGNSLRNKEWVEELEKNLRILFDETKIQYYSHWETGEKHANIEHETSILLDKVGDEDDWVVIAKSIGTNIALEAIKKGMKPQKIIFLGFPLKFFDDNDLRKEVISMINSVKSQIMFLQNSNDSFGSSDELEKFLNETKMKDYQLIEFANNETHDYQNYKKIKELVLDFIRDIK